MLPVVILVTAKAWGSYLAVIRSLGSKGVPVHIVAVGVDPAALEASKYTYSVKVYPKTEETDISEVLIAYHKDYLGTSKAVLYYCTDKDAMLVAKNRKKLSSNYSIMIGHEDSCLPLLTKDTAQVLAESKSLLCPRSWTVQSQDDLTKMLNECEFPIIVKPTVWYKSGGKGIKAEILYSSAMVSELVLPIIENEGQIIAQEYLGGDDDCIEFYLFYRSKDGKEIYDCTGRKIRQFPIGAGIMAAGISEDIPDIRAIGRNFVEAVNFYGLGGIEFKRSSGRAYFIEMSIRPEMFHKIAIDAGIDLPWISYCDLAGLDMPVKDKQLDGVVYINEVVYPKVLIKNLKTCWRDIFVFIKNKVHFAIFSPTDVEPFACLFKKKILPSKKS